MVVMLVIPRTKQMASRMLDFPDPLRPVIELKLSSLRLQDQLPGALVEIVSKE